MNSLLLKVSGAVGLLLIGVIICSADVSHIVRDESLPVTDVCLGCICEASSGCNRTLQCNGEVCGLFRITWAYWSDAGKPTQSGETPDTPNAYPNCVNEPFCAARAVQGYMRKFGQDCNGDNVINCYDFAAIHKFGGYGCKGDLPFSYKNSFDQCIAYAISQSNQAAQG